MPAAQPDRPHVPGTELLLQLQSGWLPYTERGLQITVSQISPVVSLYSGYWSPLCLSRHLIFHTLHCSSLHVPGLNSRNCSWHQPSLASGLHSSSEKHRHSIHPTEAQTSKKNGSYSLPSADCLFIALWVSSMQMDYTSLLPWRVMEPLASVLLAKAHLPADSTKPALCKCSSGRLIYKSFSLKVWHEVWILVKKILRYLSEIHTQATDSQPISTSTIRYKGSGGKKGRWVFLNHKKSQTWKMGISWVILHHANEKTEFDLEEIKGNGFLS